MTIDYIGKDQDINNLPKGVTGFPYTFIKFKWTQK